MLRGIKRVLPRWQVEQTLEKEGQKLLSPSERVLSKVSTQLLRWGRL